MARKPGGGGARDPAPWRAVAARQAGLDGRGGVTRQDRDSVVGFLAVVGGMHAQCLDLAAREILVRQLELLQSDDIARVRREPLGEVWQGAARAVSPPRRAG